MSQHWAGIGTFTFVGCLRVIEPVLSPHLYMDLIQISDSEKIDKNQQCKDIGIMGFESDNEMLKF